uniref:Uncharacterized protein n=1 Tax=uncultured marine virus TaxID=186617 RepID=A0A0F7L541_9VIRU|nr:hypothetical protein [uncultured marine virus]
MDLISHQRWIALLRSCERLNCGVSILGSPYFQLFTKRPHSIRWSKLLERLLGRFEKLSRILIFHIITFGGAERITLGEILLADRNHLLGHTLHLDWRFVLLNELPKAVHFLP